MNYQEFVKLITTGLQNRLGEAYEIRVTEIIKNNNVPLTGVVIIRQESNISPTIYLEGFYERYRDGESIQQIIREIVLCYERDHAPEQMDMEFFQNYGLARKNIFYKLVHYDMNEQQLQNQPHIRWNDLAVTFYYALEESPLGRATITIRNEHLHIWGISQEQLYLEAQDNMKRSRPELLLPMKDMLEDMMHEKLDDAYEVPMYVLTNSEKLYGASALLYSDEIRALAQRLQSDLLILPSSVHEVLLLEDEKEQDYDFYRQMVQEVNSGHVEPEEVLSPSIYRYDRQKECIEEIR